MHFRHTFLSSIAMTALLAGLVVASSPTPAMAGDDHPWGEWADCDKISDGRMKHCSQTISEWKASGKPIRVDAGRNGGTSVAGWDKDMVRVQATLMVRADSEEEAEAIAAKVKIRLEQDLIVATGPEVGDDENWSVYFRIWTPRKSDLDLLAENGGVGVNNVSGKMRLSTHNGPIHLRGVSGDVLGRTQNGPLTVELDGASWKGKGLDAETRNGPVTLRLPEDYSAVLETGTRNGPRNIDMPVSTNRTDWFAAAKRGDWFTAELGDGGAPVRVVTRNGPLNIKAR